MTGADFEPFRRMLALVAEQYGKPMSPDLIRLYFDALRHYELQAVRVALNAHVGNPDVGQFMPKVADIVRALDGTNADSALLAWAKVEQAVKHVGSYSTVVFDEPIIHAIIADMGGWIDLCATQDKEWPFKGNEFVRRYRGYREKVAALQYPKLLHGRFDLENLAKGYSAQSPVLVGDAGAALAVLESGSDKPRVGMPSYRTPSHRSTTR